MYDRVVVEVCDSDGDDDDDVVDKDAPELEDDESVWVVPKSSDGHEQLVRAVCLCRNLRWKTPLRQAQHSHLYLYASPEVDEASDKELVDVVAAVVDDNCIESQIKLDLLRLLPVVASVKCASALWFAFVVELHPTTSAFESVDDEEEQRPLAITILSVCIVLSGVRRVEQDLKVEADASFEAQYNCLLPVALRLLFLLRLRLLLTQSNPMIDRFGLSVFFLLRFPLLRLHLCARRRFFRRSLQ